MAFNIRRVQYFYTTVEDQPGEAYKLLSQLAEVGVNLLAFTAIPVGPMHTQLSLFPDDSARMATEGKRIGMKLDGPYRALLVRGDDELGALAEIHAKLYDAKVNIYASNGVTDGKGSYGYVIYVRPEEFKRAATALEV